MSPHANEALMARSSRGCGLITSGSTERRSRFMPSRGDGLGVHARLTMVDETATFARNNNFARCRFGLVQRLRSGAARLPCSLSVPNGDRSCRARCPPVDAELDLTRLFFTAVATSGVTVPTLGSGIRPRGLSDLTERADHAHQCRARRSHVEGHVARLTFGQVWGRPCRRCRRRQPGPFLPPWRLGEWPRAWSCRCRWQHDGATHDLVGLLGVDAELHRDVDGPLSNWWRRTSLTSASVGQRIQLVVDLTAGLGLLGIWSFTVPPQSRTPMEMAELRCGTHGSVDAGGVHVLGAWSWRFPRAGRGDLANLVMRLGRALCRA